MNCSRPLMLNRDTGKIEAYKPGGEASDKYLLLPCRSCLACRANYAKDWAVRLEWERAETPEDEAWFITLTYQDEPKRYRIQQMTGEVECNTSLEKKDLQLFIRRAKKRWPTLRYFACGEYGARTGRAHYHGAFFNMNIPDLRHYSYNKNYQPLWTSETINQLWGKGYCIIGKLEYGSAQYIAKYIAKADKDIRQKDWELWTGKQRPFLLMSKRPGIGEAYIKKYHETLAKDRNTLIAGYRRKLPKYAIEKLTDIDPIEMEMDKLERREYAIKQEQLTKTLLTNKPYLQRAKDDEEAARKKMLRD